MNAANRQARVVVGFPNALVHISPVLLDLIQYAYFKSMLPSKYKVLGDGVRERLAVNTDPVLIYNGLRELVVKKGEEEKVYGTFPYQGIRAYFLISDIAQQQTRCAVNVVRKVRLLIERGDPPKLIKETREWGYVMLDSTVVNSILDSRKAFILPEILDPYLQHLEVIQNHVHSSAALESLTRKIKTILKPYYAKNAQRRAEILAPNVDLQRQLEEVDAEIAARAKAEENSAPPENDELTESSVGEADVGQTETASEG